MSRRTKTSDSSSNGVGTQSSYYGLRQNPKKSWKLFSPLLNKSLRPNPCSFCRKSFTSSRSLSAHMRSHSCLLNVSATVKNMTAEVLSVSSSSSIKAEQELQQGAVCLMMLSRGTQFWRVLEEDKCWIQYQFWENGVETRKTEYSVSGKNKMKKNVEIEMEWSGSEDQCYSGSEIYGSELYSVSESEGEDSTEVDMDLSDEEDCMVGYGSDTGSGSTGGGHRSGGSRSWMCRTCGKRFDTYQGLGGHMASQRTCHLARGEGRPSQRGRDGGHKCDICMRVFGSGQALGGHKRAHFIGVGDG